MRNLTKVLFDGLSAQGDHASPIIDTTGFGGGNLTVVLSVANGSSPAGTLTLYGCNEAPPTGDFLGNFVPTRFAAITSGATTTTTNSEKMIGPLTCCWRYVAARWTYTSGSGGDITADLFVVGME